jgi:hypothetical protein
MTNLDAVLSFRARPGTRVDDEPLITWISVKDPFFSAERVRHDMQK